MEGILLALIPALAWGSLVLVSEKLGGGAHSQTLGITAGALIFSAAAFFYKQPDLNALTWIVGLISGMGWAVGQLNQFNSVKQIGVSKTVPASTGLQLLGTTFFGAVVFKEWSSTMTVVIGLLALACLIAGVILTSAGGDKEEKKGNMKKGFLFLAVSTAGYVVYVVIIRWFEIDGWSAILPQALGMILAALILTWRHKPFNKYAVRNILAGIMWATGNIGLLLANPKVGVAVGFSLSQMGIVISTLGGIFLLGEKKTKKQMVFVVTGCLLVIAGGVLLGFTKKG